MRTIVNAMMLFAGALVFGSVIVAGLAYMADNDVAMERVEQRLEGQIAP